MSESPPIRVIGTWSELSATQRAVAVSRGTDKIFDPELRARLAG